jgi:hypothetical protein
MLKLNTQIQKLFSRFSSESAILFIFVISVASFIFITGNLPRPNLNPLKNDPNKCLDLKDTNLQLRCLGEYFSNLTKVKSADAAMSELVEMKKAGKVSQCHLYAHYIGEANFDKFQDPGQAFANCPQSCIEGCHHGVMDAYLQSFASPEQALETIPNICQSVSSEPWLKRQCLHGVGHGILHHSTVTLEKAIELCQRFNAQTAVTTCLGGVFMENIFQYLGLDPESLKKELKGMCLHSKVTSDRILMSDCVDKVGMGLVFYTKGDILAAQDLCQELLPTYRDLCKKSVEKESKIDRTELLDFKSRNDDEEDIFP